MVYEGYSESSEHYLIAFSRETSERHALSFALKMMLMYYRCIVSFNSYSMLFIATPLRSAQ